MRTYDAAPHAHAPVAAMQVLASAAVETDVGVLVALVDVLLAAVAAVAALTVARVRVIVGVECAGTRVQARLARAVIQPVAVRTWSSKCTLIGLMRTEATNRARGSA